MSIESVMPSNHLILCCPLLLLPPIIPSIRVFSNESTLCMRWPKYWSFSFSISPSNEHPGLISFRMDWLDLLAVQWTLKSSSTLQFKSINFLALSFLHCSTLTSIHTGFSTALTRQTFVGKLTVQITANYRKFLKRWEYQTILPVFCKTCMQVKKQQLDLDIEQWTDSKLGKEYVKAVYCQPYLTYT